MVEALLIYHIYSWRIPFYGKYTVIIDYVLPNGFIREGSALISNNEYNSIRHTMEAMGLTLTARSPEDHISLIESWI